MMTCACRCRSLSLAYCFFSSDISKVIRCGSMFVDDKKLLDVVFVVPVVAAGAEPILLANVLLILTFSECGEGVRLL